MKFERNWMINDLECSQEQTDRWQTKPIFKHGPEFDKSKYYVYIADFIGLPYFSGFSSGLKSHVLISNEFLSQSKFVPLPRDRAAMCSRPASKQQKKFCFVSKQACIYCIRSEG